MSHKPTTMKTLQHTSQKPMVHAEKLIKPSTIDTMHAREQARRSNVQLIANVRPKPGK